MRPIDEIPEPLRARIRGLVFDVDDTVTRGGRLERAAFDAMWELHEAGLRLAALTGRPLGWCDVIARHWPVDLAIGENGAGWVWRAGAEVHEGYFEDEATRQSQAALLERIRARVHREMPHVRVAADQRARRCDLAFDVGEHVTLGEDEVRTLGALVQEEGASVATSSVHLHVIAGGWDKARGTDRALHEVLGVDLEAELERWVFVGDSGNDAPAFARFSSTVGVRNVEAHAPRMPVPPRWITEADRGRGFAELAARLLGAGR